MADEQYTSTPIGSIFISKSTKSRDENKTEWQAAKKYLQARRENDRWIEAVTKMNAVPRLLPKGRKIYLPALAEMVSGANGAIYKGIESALKKLQSREFNPDSGIKGTYYGKESYKGDEYAIFAEMKTFLENMTALLDNYNPKNPLLQNQTYWENLIKRFYNKNGTKQAWVQKILNGDIDIEAGNRFLHAIKGESGTGINFGQVYGFITEDIITQIIQTPQIKKFLEKEMSKLVKIGKFVSPNRTALPGTIRAIITSVEKKGNSLVFTEKNASTGRPLRDSGFEYIVNENGQAVIKTAGLSAKRYNIYNGDANIGFGKLKMDKFARSFLSFNPMNDSSRTGRYSMYLYRLAGFEGFENYLLEKQGAEALFSKGEDFTSLVVVQGWLMNMADLLETDKAITASLSPAAKVASQWLGPDKAYERVTDIHSKTLHIHLDAKQLGFLKL